MELPCGQRAGLVEHHVAYLAQLPQENCTVQELLNHKGISRNGTAVSVNDRIVRHSAWESTILSEGDRVVIISAAFGG